MLRIKFASAVGVLAIGAWASAAGAATGGPPIPAFDIHAACNALRMVPEALSVDTGQPDALRHCVDAEQQARNELAREWTKFSPADRNLCVGESKSGGVAPVYSELETCLQMTRDSRQLNNQQTGDTSSDGIGAVPAEPPPGPTAQNQK
ncbi:MAG: hypothetical protein JO230_30190 [Xanthobacteraceae bacterium]|nr:hypothetical protein [Xanthobacteraceae bacterium]